MSFMKLHTERGWWYLVDGPAGTEVIPADVVGTLSAVWEGELTEDNATPEEWAEVLAAFKDYVTGEVWSVEQVYKWGCRYSAPGYMDATDWVLADTEAKAIEECKSLYGDDEEDDTDDIEDDLDEEIDAEIE